MLKIEGTGWDIGHAVRFLLSNHARYITGHVLVVDGGVTLQGPERDSEVTSGARPPVRLMRAGLEAALQKRRN